MKRGNLLRTVASVAIAMFVAFGAFGQQRDANLSVTNAVNDTISIESEIPYHVTPDAYFNPNYNGGGGWVVSSAFLWSFDGAVLTGASNPGSIPTFADPLGVSTQADTLINPDISFDGTIGDYVLAARESSRAGCAGTIQLLNIHTVDTPSVRIPVGYADVDQCGTYAHGGPVQVTIAGGKDTYWLDWTLVVDSLTADASSSLGQIPALNITETNQVHAASGDVDIDAATTFVSVDNKVTRYTYTMGGVNDRISRKSDYIPVTRDATQASWTEYGGADLVWIVIIRPAPVTGPIYHLPNL
ncbi:MAG: hypothetical protein JW723_07835 [Bacteroidales bacterium]|nr:hypothetical protein [Bacteroidales bacterium]